jgi:DNA-binding transcriptional regulator YhcF (GntR family)
MRIAIDRNLPVPIPLQLQGQIEFGVTIGDFPPGSRLPPVRELAAQLGLSPVTVASVYRTLREAGLIDSAPGRGTFVRDTSTGAAAAEIDPIDRILRQALQRSDRAGIGRATLIERLQRLAAHRGSGPAVRCAFVGVYAEVTRSYVADLRRHLVQQDEIVATTFDALREDPSPLQGRDVIFTFAHRMADLKRMAPPDASLEGVALIPSERTRVALAEIDPLAQVALISAVPEFLVTFRRAFERFASHVAAVSVSVIGTPEAVKAITEADVVVYSTGAEQVLDGLNADIRAFEYRHVPDPVQVEKVLLPAIERIRNRRARASQHQEGA